MSTWQDLVTVSLIGTERTAVPPAAVPGMPAVAGAPDDPAALLLDRAALLTAARRGGRLPERAEPLPAAESDPEPTVSRAAGHRLARLLSGEHPDLLTEWLSAAVVRGLRAPAQLLPAVICRTALVSADVVCTPGSCCSVQARRSASTSVAYLRQPSFSVLTMMANVSLDSV